MEKAIEKYIDYLTYVKHFSNPILWDNLYIKGVYLLWLCTQT